MHSLSRSIATLALAVSLLLSLGLPARDATDEYAALAGIRRWQFDPATVDGEPVNSFFFLTMSF